MPQHISTVENTLKTEAIAEDQKNPLLMLSNRTIKRTFDLFAGLLVCIISLPFLPIIALIIKMQSRGPIVFKQERTGLDGKTFVCYKFRTMRLNDECDTLQATANDPRIFPFGSFMRRTHIDEIPNFIYRRNPQFHQCNQGRHEHYRPTPPYALPHQKIHPVDRQLHGPSSLQARHYGIFTGAGTERRNSRGVANGRESETRHMVHQALVNRIRPMDTLSHSGSHFLQEKTE